MMLRYNLYIDYILTQFREVSMRSEEEVRKRLLDEIDTYLTCPKFSVEEHAHNITMLAWVVDISDQELSNLIRDAESSFS